jgi:hypothetical protein
MDLMMFGFIVDLTLWVLAGYVVVRLWGRYLPEILRDPRFTMSIFLVIGALVTMASYPYRAV